MKTDNGAPIAEEDEGEESNLAAVGAHLSRHLCGEDTPVDSESFLREPSVDRLSLPKQHSPRLRPGGNTHTARSTSMWVAAQPEIRASHERRAFVAS